MEINVDVCRLSFILFGLYKEVASAKPHSRHVIGER